MNIPWEDIQQWVAQTIETQQKRVEWESEDYDLKYTLGEYELYYYYTNWCTYFSCKKTHLLFRYFYDVNYDVLEVDFLPSIFKKIRTAFETTRLCMGCKEYHDLFEEGLYCNSCYPYVVKQGVYGICAICNTDHEGVWNWARSGLFHRTCIKEPSIDCFV